MVFLRFLFTVRIENIFRYGGLVWDAEWDPLVLTSAGDHWKRMLPRSNVGEPTPKWTPWKRRSTCLQNIRCRDILRRDLVEAIKVRVLLFSSMIAVRFLRASYACGAGTGGTQNSRSTRRRWIPAPKTAKRSPSSISASLSLYSFLIRNRIIGVFKQKGAIYKLIFYREFLVTRLLVPRMIWDF